ncbi:MFS transporter [Paraburkholderia acidisoli]|uniref:MFS transporter n=1 Tax=Paraburkholderia acidisoli TaxID=2571748 RepID=UPI001E41B473|nr:MFS transporter [Paraburkholderia acidisoli]
MAAASVGNILEIYDFIAYGIFAVPISRTFFPASSDFAALILTFITFAVGFLVRPAGALVLGRYADRAGRKKALSLTLLLMAAGTVVPAVCPSYASIGVAAPLLIVLGRLVQGFSAGGEIGGTVAMLIENAPQSRKGLFGSFQQMSQGGGTLIAGLVGLALTSCFTQAQIFGGAWRLAFAFGLLIAPVGWYIRRSVAETPDFEHAQRAPRRALWPQLVEYKGRVLTGVAIMVFWTIATYVSNYFTTYAVREVHLSLFDSYIGQVSYGIAMMTMCPIVGALSDRIGTRAPMLFGAALTAVVAYPLFLLLAHYPSLATLVAVQVAIAFLLACYAACASTVLGSVFPTGFRATGVGLAYAIGVTVFGGFTPVAVTALIGFTGDRLVIGYYLAAAALISCVPVLFISHREGKAAPEAAAVQFE